MTLYMKMIQRQQCETIILEINEEITKYKLHNSFPLLANTKYEELVDLLMDYLNESLTIQKLEQILIEKNRIIH